MKQFEHLGGDPFLTWSKFITFAHSFDHYSLIARNVSKEKDFIYCQ
jgi:hypothetical protein